MVAVLHGLNAVQALYPPEAGGLALALIGEGDGLGLFISDIIKALGEVLALIFGVNLLFSVFWCRLLNLLFLLLFTI